MAQRSGKEIPFLLTISIHLTDWEFIQSENISNLKFPWDVVYWAEMRETRSGVSFFSVGANWISSCRSFCAAKCWVHHPAEWSQNDTRPASCSRQYNISTQVVGISLLLSGVGPCWQPIIAPRRRLANLQRLHYAGNLRESAEIGRTQKGNWLN